MCWTCYYTDGVRGLYEPLTQAGVWGAAGHTGQYGADNRPLPVPTTAVPGTEAKLAVLASRSANGERLWHPQDATH